MTEHGRYDLAFEVGDRLLRVHCKWAAVRGEVVVVRLHSTYFTRTREVRVAYGADEIDAVAAYCARLERCYLLPIELVQDMRTISLHLNPPRNWQRAALHWAADYELPGAIAQLGERSAGSRKVVGSSPTSSTILRKAKPRSSASDRGFDVSSRSCALPVTHLKGRISSLHG